jgi:transcriptional regulator with XRE-family HTH domain
MWLASKIAETLRAKGWNKTEFAAMMHQTPSAISRWLSGEHNFTVDTLNDIEDVLGIDLLNRDRKKYEADARVNGTITPTAINIFVTDKDYSKIASNGNILVELLSDGSNFQLKERQTGLN